VPPVESIIAPLSRLTGDPVIRPVAAPSSRVALRAALASLPGGFMLESVASDPRHGRYSYFGFEPLEVLEVPAGSDPFARLAGAARSMARPRVPRHIPFIGGWLGYLAYEAGAILEPTAPSRRVLRDLPIARFALHDAVLVADHAADRWYVAGQPLTADPSRLPRMLAQLESVAACAVPAAFRRAIPAPLPATPITDMSRDEYRRRVRRILDYIAAGDVFQVNFAQRFSSASTEPPGDLYARLCASNPAAFAAYLPAGHGAVLSSSPELLVELSDGRAISRPIKGTRRRTGHAADDAAVEHDLAHSEKDAAELAMIVDLVRNDLGRVCEYGSVRVDDPGSIETMSTVMHRVATVSGSLRGGLDALDLLRAIFPGGSVTGAPKVRAMQIIDELEKSPRGPYCGAIGYIGLDGDMMLNLAIRTLVAVDGQVHLSVGGGIVADSDPDQEYDETLAKAAGMLSALGCRQDST